MLILGWSFLWNRQTSVLLSFDCYGKYISRYVHQIQPHLATSELNVVCVYVFYFNLLRNINYCCLLWKQPPAPGSSKKKLSAALVCWQTWQYFNLDQDITLSMNLLWLDISLKSEGKIKVKYFMSVDNQLSAWIVQGHVVLSNAIHVKQFA